MMKLITVHTVNTPDRNNRNGSNGSAARCSTRTKSPSASSDPIAIEMMTVDVQAYSLPPHVVTSVSPVAASPMNRMPR